MNGLSEQRCSAYPSTGDATPDKLMVPTAPASPAVNPLRPVRRHIGRPLEGHMRDLTEHEQIIVRLCREKYGAHDRDKMFFLESGDAVLQVWGTEGDGPWVHLTNLGNWLAEGIITEDEIKSTQM
jgi:hypothetical protein